jgi:predicted DsbA family dithiol-disulfide isomerase
MPLPETHAYHLPPMPAAPRLSIEVSFDLICPWCLIGHRHLATAIALLREERPEVTVDVEWRSCPLIPDTPLEGLPYRAFYIARLGSPQAVAMRQAQVRAAAHEAGLTLALERIETFPNTLLAHRLVRFAREQQGAQAASALVENLFTRYFVRAENIGDAQVLREALAECGIATPGGTEAPLHHDLDWLPRLEDGQPSSMRGATGVPHFVFDGALPISGAVPPAALLRSMHRALARSAQPA